MTGNETPILKLVRIKTKLDIQRAIETVRKETGKGSLRQMVELARLAVGPQRLGLADYYLEGLWRTELSGEERAAFVSEQRSMAYNRALSPINGSGLHGLFADKLLTNLALRAAGFPVLKPLAIFGKFVCLPGTAQLATASDISAFLLGDGNLPVYGKPLHGSLSIGAASFVGTADGGKSIILGNGKVVGVDRLSREIASNFDRGYVFEPLIRQHPDVEAVTGPAVGGLRVVTLRAPEGAELLYTLQRLPAVGAMMDAMSAHGAYLAAHVDPGSGRILRVRAMDAMPTEALYASPVTGKRFDQAVLPFVKEAIVMAQEAHRLFARPGLLGFDFALTAKGPVVTEINSNPFHTTYQHAADRGFLNPDFKPRIKQALAIVESET